MIFVHVVKGQGQIVGLCSSVVFSTSPDPLCWKVAKLGTVNASREQMTPFDVQDTWSWVKVKLLVFEKVLSTQYIKLAC